MPRGLGALCLQRHRHRVQLLAVVPCMWICVLDVMHGGFTEPPPCQTLVNPHRGVVDVASSALALPGNLPGNLLSRLQPGDA